MTKEELTKVLSECTGPIVSHNGRKCKKAWDGEYADLIVVESGQRIVYFDGGWRAAEDAESERGNQGS